MPDAAVVTPRQLYQEDLAPTTIPIGDTDLVDVLGAVGPQTLNKIPITLLTQLVQAANDAGAAAGGVGVGICYYCTADQKLHTRMS